MREEYCEACETLKEDAYTFATKGVTTGISNRLKQDNGFASPSTVDTDCEALNIGNDCLIGGQEDTLENYDVCDIKVWLKESWANLHTMLKAMIAAICGLWTKVHCILSGLGTLISQLTKEDSFSAKSEYAISGGANTSTEIAKQYSQYIIPTTEYPYQERTVANGGLTYDDNTKTAYIGDTVNGTKLTEITYPSDGVAIVGCCAYMKNYTGRNSMQVTFYHSGETPTTVMRNKRGLHYGDYESAESTTVHASMSESMTTAIKVKAGTSLRIWVNSSSDYDDQQGVFGIHQVWSVFVPEFTSALNIDPTIFDSCGE